MNEVNQINIPIDNVCFNNRQSESEKEGFNEPKTSSSAHKSSSNIFPSFFNQSINTPNSLRTKHDGLPYLIPRNSSNETISDVYSHNLVVPIKHSHNLPFQNTKRSHDSALLADSLLGVRLYS